MKDGNNYMQNKKILTNNSKQGGADYRYYMVQYAKKHGISAAARDYKTTRKTVQKWLRAFDKRGNDGLKYASRIGQAHPNATPPEVIESILNLRGDSRIGADFIKDSLELSYTSKTIHKYLKRNGKVKKAKTKAQKKRDMSEMREKIKVIEKLQVDVKYLTDIPNLLMGIKFNELPKYVIVCRDYKSGITFIGYSYFKDSTSVGIFIAYVVFILIKAGIDMKKIHFQFDNGSEFRSTTKKKGLSLVEEILLKHGIKYKFNPPSRPTYNSDVESFNGTIERELFDYIKPENLDEFMFQSWSYMTWYNAIRKNRNKNRMSPAQILKENEVKKINFLTTCPPILVDKYIQNIKLIKMGVYLKWLATKKNQKNT